MRFWTLFTVLLVGVFALSAQNSSNPFELSPRLDPALRVEARELRDTATPGANPFDLQRPGQQIAPSGNIAQQDTSAVNPFDLVVPATPIEPITLETNDTKKADDTQDALAAATGDDPGTNGALLLITSLLLSAATLSIIFFLGM